MTVTQKIVAAANRHRMRGEELREQARNLDHVDDMNRVADAVRAKNRDLVNECHDLREALDEAHEIINFWANGSEAFRLTMHHLREHWPAKAGEETDINKIVAQKHQGVRDDPEWKTRKDAITDQQRQKIRARKRRPR